MRLENWFIIHRSSPYTAPELCEACLCGNVYDDLRREDGHHIITNSIIGKTIDNEIVTKSGSRYTLGEVSIDYVKNYPDAFNRLLDSLDII